MIFGRNLSVYNVQLNILARAATVVRLGVSTWVTHRTVHLGSDPRNSHNLKSTFVPAT